MSTENEPIDLLKYFIPFGLSVAIAGGIYTGTPEVFITLGYLTVGLSALILLWQQKRWGWW